MHLEDLHFTTQFCIAISDTHSRKWPLKAKDYLLVMHKSRKRVSSASVIWHIVSFGQDGTYRPIASFLVMWFLCAGAQLLLLDPHKSNKKRGLYHKLEPLQAWFIRDAIDCLDPDELLEYIDWLEGEYKDRKRSMAGKLPLLVVIDEINELLGGLSTKEAKRVAMVLGNCARGGSKFGMFLIAIGHNFDLASVPNAVRKNIVGRISVLAETGEQATILNYSDTKRIIQLATQPRPLRPGEALVKVPGYGLYRLHYPLVNREYLAAFATFMRKIGAEPTVLSHIDAHQYSDTLPSLLSTPHSPTSLYAIPTNVVTNATNIGDLSTNSGTNITAEERAIIETAGKIQMQETGGVNRTKLLKDIGWQNRNKGYTKVKIVCDEHGWKLSPKQDKLDPDVWEAIKRQHEYTCQRCKRREPEITLEPDRIVPEVKGGSYTPENVQPLCKSCNSSKREQIVDYREREVTV